MRNSPLKQPIFAVSDRWANRDQVIFGKLWFEFLLFSPSYELARKHRARVLDDADRQRIPEDFETVLAVFDDLGDVQRVKFDDWWLAKGIRFFGYQGERPSVQAIEALLSETPDPLDRLSRRAADYIAGRWHEQGQQASLIISIPIGMPKARIMDQIADLLAQTPEARKQLSSGPPKYPIHGTKRDVDSLFRYIKCVLHKAFFHPRIKLWEIGMLADLSSTYSSRLAKGEGNSDDQQALKILTSRALHRGIMIAENAARGIFPSYQPCENAVAPDWRELGNLLESHQDWFDQQE